MRAGASDSELTENDTGTGPATPVSPALSATGNQQEDEHQPATPITFRSETDELTRRNLLPADLMPVEEEGSPDVEILKIASRLAHTRNTDFENSFATTQSSPEKVVCNGTGETVRTTLISL